MRISDWSSDVCSSDLGGAALVGDDLQPVARQVEVAHYLRPQQAADVGAVGVGPAGIELAAGRGAADVVAALQRQGLEAASRQVAGSGEAVVAGTHDNNVIARHASASPVLSRAWTELRQGPAAGLYFF